MSIQVGLVKLKGKMDGISFFQSGGKHVARMANGPDKKRILTDKRYARTRENNAEFGGCAKAAAAFRSAVRPVLNLADNRITSRLISIFKEINLLEPGVRGQRSILLSQHREQLINFDFDINLPVSALFTGMIKNESTPDRLGATIKFENALLNRITDAPSNATHVKFTQLLATWCDHVYNAELNKYEPVLPKFQSANIITNSEYFSLSNKTPLTFSLQSTLQDEAPNESISVLHCFGLSFYQQTGENFYLLNRGSAMKVIDIF